MQNNIFLSKKSGVKLVDIAKVLKGKKISSVEREYDDYSMLKLIHLIQTSNIPVGFYITDEELISNLKEVFEVTELLITDYNSALEIAELADLEEAKKWHDSLNERHQYFVRLLCFKVISPIPTAG